MDPIDSRRSIGFFDLPLELRWIVYELVAPDFNWRRHLPGNELHCMSSEWPWGPVALRQAHPALLEEFDAHIDKKQGELAFVVKPEHWNAPSRIDLRLERLQSIFIWIDHYDIEKLGQPIFWSSNRLMPSSQALVDEFSLMRCNMAKFLDLLRMAYWEGQPLPRLTVAFKDVAAPEFECAVNADNRADPHWVQTPARRGANKMWLLCGTSGVDWECSIPEYLLEPLRFGGGVFVEASIRPLRHVGDWSGVVSGCKIHEDLFRKAYKWFLQSPRREHWDWWLFMAQQRTELMRAVEADRFQRGLDQRDADYWEARGQYNVVSDGDTRVESACMTG